MGLQSQVIFMDTHVRDEQGREALQRQAPSENKPFGEKSSLLPPVSERVKLKICL